MSEIALKWLADNGYYLSEKEAEGFAAILRPYIPSQPPIKWNVFMLRYETGKAGANTSALR